MDILALIAVLLLLAYFAAKICVKGVGHVVTKLRRCSMDKRARAEAELDRQQAELRAAILNLASQLGAEAHEARKALIRESFLAAQNPPDRTN
jgi:hypothetical protein